MANLKESIVLSFDPCIYSKDAILATGYNFTNIFGIQLKYDPEKNISVSLTPVTPMGESEKNVLLMKFRNDLIDNQIRIDLEKKFSSLREIIVKHAFSPIENLGEEVKKIAGRK